MAFESVEVIVALAPYAAVTFMAYFCYWFMQNGPLGVD
jgi:hypothetical protein